jgi:DNA-binding SARP family transcriptional activator
VIDREQAVSLGGIRPRATLGFLLLHNNSMVPASKLIKALWPTDTPATGRKMLHNAISRVRGMLDAQELHPDGSVLLTHTPGYFLRVSPEALDLTCFQAQAEQGHTQLLAGSWEEAASTLRDGLKLWRGSALVDLVEAGISWPELTALENSKLVALEDCVEAEMASGRHAEVISELEMYVETGPLRERMSGQLMRALYHCGRQSDALGLYQRTRTELVEQFGLDPSPRLQEFERAILNHDLTSGSVLTRPEVPRPQDAPIEVRAVPAAEIAAAPEPVEPPVVAADDPAGLPIHPPARIAATDGQDTLDASESENVRRAAMADAGELKQVSLVLVMATPAPGDPADPEHTELVRRRVVDSIKDEAERWGGSVAGTLGPLWLVVFGAPKTCESDAWRAVQGAFAIRDRFREERAAAVEGSGMAVTASVAVAIGEALVRPQVNTPGMPPMVTGEILDRALNLLTSTPSAEVSICDTTIRASEALTFDLDDAGPLCAVTESTVVECPVDAPFVGRERDLEMLRDLFLAAGTTASARFPAGPQQIRRGDTSGRLAGHGDVHVRRADPRRALLQRRRQLAGHDGRPVDLRLEPGRRGVQRLLHRRFRQPGYRGVGGLGRGRIRRRFLHRGRAERAQDRPRRFRQGRYPRQFRHPVFRVVRGG